MDQPWIHPPKQAMLSEGVARASVPPPPEGVAAFARPRTAGRFVEVGGRKIYLAGITYGPFPRGDDGIEYPTPAVVRQDCAAMADAGFNAIRTYTAPPRWLLDTAEESGLLVLVGLPWAQHVTFLDDRRVARQIQDQVRRSAQRCAAHPALLGFTVGNEIPAPIVRWLGARRVEGFIRELTEITRSEDPEALVTYVNYPTTEYLELPFLDFVSFNVYLERRCELDAYLARLHNLAGDLPLVMAEVGLDSLRNGEARQAEALEWQVDTSLASGCAGAFVFAWTDEWQRGGVDIDDWAFGITTRTRQPKPAMTAVSEAFARAPFQTSERLPSVSVIVCTHNGSRTIRQTLEHLEALEYGSYEVIVVNDGSTDHTRQIVEEFNVRVVNTENRGLSSARNTGAEAATGEILAFIDDDAYPDPHWLHYLGQTFKDTEYAAIGGPNILPPDSSPIAECVKHAPGGPTHVLLTDSVAEHLPGCNLAVRKRCWEAVGGFDPQFRTAGDDVDFCWRLQERGWELGFHPGAVVWHHCRDSILRYWKQQRGYGRAEALLERKWPERYNSAGHLSWAGRLYGPGFYHDLGSRPPRIYYGTWGRAPFQRLYHPGSNFMLSATMMPEWHLVTVALGVLSLAGLFWTSLLWALPAFLVALALPVTQGVRATVRSSRGRRGKRVFWDRARFLGITTLLHVTQPIVRLWGRFREGLTPWRRRAKGGFAFPGPRTVSIWSDRWQPVESWLGQAETAIRAAGLVPQRGGPHDRWDLQVGGGPAGGIRVLMAVEEHGGGRQYVKFRVRQHARLASTISFTGLMGLVALTLKVTDPPIVGRALLALLAAVSVGLLVRHTSRKATVLRSLQSLDQPLDSGRRDRPRP